MACNGPNVMSQASFWRSWAELLHRDFLITPNCLFRHDVVVVFQDLHDKVAGTPTTGETDITLFMLGWGLFLVTHTDSYLPPFVLLPPFLVDAEPQSATGGQSVVEPSPSNLQSSVAPPSH